MPEPGKHTTWERTQMAITALTGIVALFISVGQFQMSRKQQDLKTEQEAISHRLAQMKAEQETVASVGEYFALLAGADTSQAKMGAYAVYMLKRDDPEMVVSLILASDKPALRNTVLQDLANRDPRIREHLVSVLGSGSGTATAAPTEQKVYAASVAEEVLSSVTTQGWAYVGVHRNGRWVDGPMLRVGAAVPTAGATSEIGARSLYLRAGHPDPVTNRHGDIEGVLSRGQRVRVEEIWQRPNAGHVWARVTVADVGA